jgi:hypothetical protein
MPTHDQLDSFFHDYKRLTEAEKAIFRQAVGHFARDLRTGDFRKGLPVKKMSGHDDIWELTWAPDGRVTFQYGPEPPGRPSPHIIWRRIGSHDISGRP